MEFLTGFNNRTVTKTGYSIENENFSITFRGILYLGAESNLAFENCYDWTPVMEILMKVENFKHSIRSILTQQGQQSRYDMFEYLLTLDLDSWVKSFAGFGILWNIIRPDYQDYLSDNLEKVRAEMEDEDDFSTLKVFTEVVKMFNDEFDVELNEIIPPINIVINDCMGTNEQPLPREKEILIQFGFPILATFRIHKKVLNDELTLLDLAGEVVVKTIVDKKDIEQLDMPKTLVRFLEEKLWDVWWVDGNNSD